MINLLVRIAKAFSETCDSDYSSPQDSNELLSANLNENMEMVNNAFADSFDFVTRKFSLGMNDSLEVCLCYLDGLNDTKVMAFSLLKPLMFEFDSKNNNIIDETVLDFIKEKALAISNVGEIVSKRDLFSEILSGSAALFIEGSDIALCLNIKGWESRNIKEPDTEVTVRGPREGFVETLSTNITLIRRRIKNSNLKFEKMAIGTQTNTDVCIVYLKGIVNMSIVAEVKKRLNRIKTDSILESGYIESFIQDAPFSIFSTVGNSEKPDKVCGKILEGRVAILIDGTPFVLTVPNLFIEGFQSSEDYYSRPFYVSFISVLRWIGFIISIMLPAFYVAVVTYHQELIPPKLMVSIAAAVEGVPFPTAIEAFIIQLAYEILREAGVRLPRPIGQAVSIVGALVIGEAAVSAGLIGAPMVIVVALTAIASFLVPTHADVGALLRFAFIILAGVAGFYGIVLGDFLVLIHLCSLRSFGVPYLSPLAPLNVSGLKDLFIRVPWWAMKTRPFALKPENSQRQQFGQKPRPPGEENDRTL